MFLSRARVRLEPIRCDKPQRDNSIGLVTHTENRDLVVQQVSVL